MTDEMQPLPRDNSNSPNTAGPHPKSPDTDKPSRRSGPDLRVMNVPPRLQSLASSALALSAMDAPRNTIHVAQALKQALSAHVSPTCPRVTPPASDSASASASASAAESDAGVIKKGEELALRNMSPTEEEQYTGWRAGTMTPPTVDWAAFRDDTAVDEDSDKIVLDEEMRKTARRFRANANDLATMYEQDASNVTADDLAKWLADTSLSTPPARALLLSLGRVRRCRARVAAKSGIRDTTNQSNNPRSTAGAGVGEDKGEGGRQGPPFAKREGRPLVKDMRVLRAIVKHVRDTRADVQKMFDDVLETLQDVETVAEAKMEQLVLRIGDNVSKLPADAPGRIRGHGRGRGRGRGHGRGRGRGRGPGGRGHKEVNIGEEAAGSSGETPEITEPLETVAVRLTTEPTEPTSRAEAMRD